MNAVARTAAPPPDWGVRLDGALQRFEEGKVLLGGSPLRLLRLKAAGAAVVDGFALGERIGSSKGRSTLARRLFDGGLAHPQPTGAPFGAESVTVVVPVCDDLDGLLVTLRSLEDTADRAPLAIVVIDDGSSMPVGMVGGASVQVCRRPAPGGPAVARQCGLARVATPYVAFIDAGVRVPPGWLESLAAYFADPAVVAVAPRVSSEPGSTLLERYEMSESPLDLGAEPARVAPRSRVAYVPTAMIMARRAALDAAGGFDPGLRFGEDVDLVWRLVAGGGTVRYAPEIVAHHRPRRSFSAWMRQRVGYGSAAAPLEARHPGSVPPVQVSAWSAAAWTIAAAGHPLAGLGAAAVSTAMLPRKLVGMPDPWRLALSLAGRGHLMAGRWLARAMLRPYWPVAVALALVSRRARRVLVAAAVIPALADWQRHRPDVHPARFVALRVADDVAYGAGVWQGCWRQRSAAALRPDLASWPGQRHLGEPAT